jgi:hypothetical protein
MIEKMIGAPSARRKTPCWCVRGVDGGVDI